MKRMTPAAVAGIAAATLAQAACQAEAGAGAPVREPNRLHLQAVGEVRSAPDLATVTAGVVAEAKTAAAAMADQRARMTGVVEALKAAGVADKDIQTAGLDLSPVYTYPDRSSDGSNEPRITGYRASNRVTAVARDLTKVGPTLDALVAAGANTIDGISFGIEERDALEDQARRKAVAEILERAGLYADAADFRLGPILDMSEQAGFQPMPATFARSMAMESGGATPVEGGEMVVSVTVSATFEITP